MWRTTLLLGSLILLADTRTSHAALAYITGGTTISAWDTSTNTVSTVVPSADGGSIDSLVFDTNGNIIYSIIGTSKLGVYNTITHTNHILATTGPDALGPGVADMALDPSGTSVLVSNAFGTTI